MSRTQARRGSRHGAGLRARLLAALLTLAVLPSLAGAQSVEDKYQQHRDRMSRFNLAAGPTTVLAVNQFQCGLNSEGDTCTDVFDSPTGGGGFWPTGSPNQYMFNSGLQVVGIIPNDAGFEWAGDTVGAFFMDASGNYAHGTAITPIYNSLDPEDLANWPTPGSVPDFPSLSGIVDDEELFNPVLIGRQAASQQDSWVAYWDGDPNKTGGRTHPMGIVVEQRTMAWNYPEGAESVVFLVYKFTNATNNPLFQRLNETKYGIQLPDGGWTFDSIYVAYDSDPDVGTDATNNYATGILAFNLGLAYEGPMQDPNFIYPSSIFHAPFFTNAPGLVGMKYLKSPTDPVTGEEVGLTSLSQHTNGGAFPDPNTVQRGWRYISLNVDAGKGDPSCSFPQAEVKERRACYLSQSQSDVRLFIGSGPFSLGPGESATIAVAMYAAATVNTPEIILGGDNKPGIPSPIPGCNGDPIRAIERAAGWISADCPGEGETFTQFDVEVVPNSLLGRGLVAQAIFDNKFLLGFAPEAPPFYLVPGDDQVTVVWEQSRTEVEGDPFIAAAGDPENELYDPNYREFDVEGYRIYRGTSPANLELIAQFDKEGSVFVDRTCITDPTHLTVDPCEDVHEVDISSPFIQYVTVSELATGDPIVIQADTVLNNEMRGDPITSLPLTNTGIPFAYIDNDVRNGFQYFYKVTAFDVNSVRSTPSSLESAAGAKSTVPRASPATQFAQFSSFLQGGDEVLDPAAPLPTIDAADGTFSGPMPPTNGIQAAFAPLVERLLPAFNLTATIDSMIPLADDGSSNCTNGSSGLGSCWNMYVTYNRDGQTQQIVQNGFTPTWSAFGEHTSETWQLGAFAINPDPDAAATFGMDPENISFNATVRGDFRQYIDYSSHENQAARRAGVVGIPTNIYAGGSRWFSGENETVADPARFNRVGHIEGVDTIFAPISHTPIDEAGTTLPSTAQCFPYPLAFLGRAADVEFRWGASGPEVFDVTHNVPVMFKPTVQASYGFLVDDANGNGVIDWQDFNYIAGAAPLIANLGFCGTPDERVTLQQTPELVPVSTANAITGTMAPTGNGFGLYINGERYIFQMAQLPTTGTWTLRTYTGFVRASSGAATADPSGYSFVSRVRPPTVPGLQVVFAVEQPTLLVADSVDLTRVHTVPDPYYAVSQYDRGPQAKELRFVNLPPEATIRIYSLSGVLVDIITHNDATGGGSAAWDLRNRSNQFVASGVYFFHVSTPDGREHLGKFTVVNAGFGR